MLRRRRGKAKRIRKKRKENVNMKRKWPK